MPNAFGIELLIYMYIHVDFVDEPSVW